MDELIKIIYKYTADGIRVEPLSELKNDLCLCSLDLLQITMEVEIILGKRLNTNNIPLICTVKDFWDNLEQCE